MALSGSFKTVFSTGYALVVDWAESNVNTATNTSDITVTAKLQTIKGTYHIDSTANKTITLTIDGVTYTGTCTVGIEALSTKTLFTKTVTGIAHDASSGAKSVSISCTLNIKVTLNGSSVSSVTASDTVALTTIPRVSKPSLSSSSVDMDTNLTIYTNRASDSFTHTLQYSWEGSSFVNITTSVGANYTWKVPLSLANSIPNDTVGNGTIRCITYSGSTQIGYDDIPFQATVPSSVKPTCTFEVSDPTGIWATYGYPVKGLSKFKITTTGTTAYSSPISSYSVVVKWPTSGTSSFSGNDITTDFLTEGGMVEVDATVKDSRGRPGSASTLQVNTLDYSLPAVTALSVHRCKSATDGTEDGQGAYVRVTFSASVANINNQNTATYKLRYTKLSDKTSSGWITLIGSGGVLSTNTKTYSPKNQNYIFAADTGSSYKVEIVATDNHKTSDTATTTASTGFTLIHYGADGRSIAFGKISEKENTFELGLPVDGLVNLCEVFKPASDAEIDTIMTAVYNAMPDESKKSITLHFTYSSSVLGGGRWSVDIYRGSLNYGYAIVARYENSEYPTICTRCYYSGAWGEWGQDLTRRNLLLSGGTITGDLTVNGTLNATVSKAGSLTAADNRSTNQTPEWYMTTYGAGAVYEFKFTDSIGFTNASTTYCSLHTIIPWKDQSGGFPQQYAFFNGEMWKRTGSSATAWGAWRSMLDSASTINATTLSGCGIAYCYNYCDSLYSGSLAKGASTTVALNSKYSGYVVMGKTTASSAICSIFIPRWCINTTRTLYQYADEAGYVSFYVSHNGTNVTIARQNQTNANSVITGILGVS